MSDLISRQAALALPRNKVISLRTHEVVEETINVTDIEQLPSVQPNLQPTCNQLATDCISRKAVIDVIFSEPLYETGMKKRSAEEVVPAIFEKVKVLPSAQSDIIRCNACKHWTQTTGNMPGFGLGDCDYLNAKLVSCNGFCYWAERRTDEDD